jgi:hypothetical protein
MFFITYVSSAATLFTHSELTELLEKSRVNNAALDISGMLLYKDGNFMQVIEGEEDAVRRLYDKVARDPRHRGLITLLQGTLTERQFPGWSMGFRDLRAADALAVPGYDEFLNTPLTDERFSSDPTRCQRLLNTFKRSM